MITRVVEPEILDTLDPEHPLARGSRKDLQRLNAWMRSAPKVADAFERQFPLGRPATVVELGAGDGSLLVNVAQLLPRQWTDIDVVLIDRQEKLAAGARELFARRGWKVAVVNRDVFDWLKEGFASTDVILCNLFLHHFQTEQLKALFNGIAQRTKCFIALEPLRNGAGLFFSNLVGLIGCNKVTRHDAPVSVRAGFRDKELSALWPDPNAWVLEEGNAGWCSQLFVAKRRT